MSDEQPTQTPGWWARVFGSQGAKASAEQRVETLSREVDRLHEVLADHEALLEDQRAKAARIQSLEAMCSQLEVERDGVAQQASKQIQQLEEELDLAVKANGGLAAERDLARERHARQEQENTDIQKRYQGLIDAQRYTSGALQQLQDRVRADGNQIAELEVEMEKVRTESEQSELRLSSELELTAKRLRVAEQAAATAESEALALRAELEQSSTEEAGLAEAQATIEQLATALRASHALGTAFARHWFGDGAPVAMNNTPHTPPPHDLAAVRHALQRAGVPEDSLDTDAGSSGLRFLSRALAAPSAEQSSGTPHNDKKEDQQ